MRRKVLSANLNIVFGATLARNGKEFKIVIFDIFRNCKIWVFP